MNPFAVPAPTGYPTAYSTSSSNPFSSPGEDLLLILSSQLNIAATSASAYGGAVNPFEQSPAPNASASSPYPGNAFAPPAQPGYSGYPSPQVFPSINAPSQQPPSYPGYGSPMPGPSFSPLNDPSYYNPPKPKGEVTLDVDPFSFVKGTAPGLKSTQPVNRNQSSEQTSVFSSSSSGFIGAPAIPAPSLRPLQLLEFRRQ